MEEKDFIPGEDYLIPLSEEQRRHINEGIDDEENDRVISSEEFWRNLKNQGATKPNKL